MLPIAFGCEAGLLEPKAAAVIVGYGETESGSGDGPKRWAAAPVRLRARRLLRGRRPRPSRACAPATPAAPRCSGPPTTPGGCSASPRSTRAGCGGIGHYAYAERATLARRTGRARPHALPRERRQLAARLPLRPFRAGEQRRPSAPGPTSCAAAPAGPAGTGCGPAFDASPDDTPPTVAITSPEPGPQPGPTAVVEVVVAAEDVGWGVAEVALEIDGEVQARDEEPQWRFGAAEFAPGSHTLVAIAEDAAGHVTRSEPVVLEVEGDSASGGGAGEGSEGCGCRSGERPRRASVAGLRGTVDGPCPKSKTRARMNER